MGFTTLESTKKIFDCFKGFANSSPALVGSSAFCLFGLADRHADLFVVDVSRFSTNDWLKKSCSFDCNVRGEVHLFKCASFGKLAVVSSEKDVFVIDIWGNECSSLEMTLEYQLTFDNSPVRMIDWFTSFDGQQLLAVAF